MFQEFLCVEKILITRNIKSLLLHFKKLFKASVTKRLNLNVWWLLCGIFYCYAEFHYAECRYAECHYAECHYAECHYAQCHYAECHYAECQYAESHYA